MKSVAFIVSFIGIKLHLCLYKYIRRWTGGFMAGFISSIALWQTGSPTERKKPPCRLCSLCPFPHHCLQGCHLVFRASPSRRQGSLLWCCPLPSAGPSTPGSQLACCQLTSSPHLSLGQAPLLTLVLTSPQKMAGQGCKTWFINESVLRKSI